MGLGRERPGRPDPQLAVSEGADAGDRVTRAGVAGGASLEPRQRPLGTVGGLRGDPAPVGLAQRQGTRQRPFAFSMLMTSTTRSALSGGGS